ncbi:MAG: hypothetical protein Q8R24_09090 [Legionellaceae bacterium]|nr:hypothetical protein [Legionellaceae bacterium]
MGNTKQETTKIISDACQCVSIVERAFNQASSPKHQHMLELIQKTFEILKDENHKYGFAYKIEQYRRLIDKLGDSIKFDKLFDDLNDRITKVTNLGISGVVESHYSMFGIRKKEAPFFLMKNGSTESILEIGNEVDQQSGLGNDDVVIGSLSGIQRQ